MEIVKKVAQQTGWQLIGKVTTSFSTLLILSLITRTYGESGTGVFTLSLTLLAFFALAVDFGLNAYVLTRFKEDSFREEWRKLFGFRVLLIFIFTLVALIVVYFYPQDSLLFKLITLFGLVSVIEAGVFVTANALFQYKLRYDLSTFSWVAGTLATLVSVYIIIAQKLPLHYLIYGYILGWIVISVVSLILVKKLVGKISPIFDVGYIKAVLRNSWPLSITLIMNVIYFRVDAFILSFSRSFSDVGVYNLAFQIFQAALVVPTFIMNGLYPLLLKTLREDRKLFMKQVRNAAGIMLVISLLGTGLTWLLAPFIITIMTGSGFSGSVESLRILSLSFPAFFLSALLMWIYLSLRRYKVLTLVYFFGLLINSLLNYILIPRYSYIGASWVTVFSEYMILVLLITILYPSLKNNS